MRMEGARAHIAFYRNDLADEDDERDGREKKKKTTLVSKILYLEFGLDWD